MTTDTIGNSRADSAGADAPDVEAPRDAAETGQVSRTAADIYEEFFVPALFEEPSASVLDAARVAPGGRVLDVACGTGVLARAARACVGDEGAVVGVDRNPGMLAVARRIAPDIDWRESMAESLAFPDGGFDAVVSQFGLMFFEDRAAALREMHRVLRPDGRMAVAVWAPLDQTPGYAAMRSLLDRLFGPAAAASLDAPYCLGDPADLRAVFAEAGLEAVEIERRPCTARFASVDSWVHTDIRGWTLADAIDDAQFARLQAAAPAALARFVDGEGRVAFDHPALIATLTKAA